MLRHLIMDTNVFSATIYSREWGETATGLLKFKRLFAKKVDTFLTLG